MLFLMNLQVGWNPESRAASTLCDSDTVRLRVPGAGFDVAALALGQEWKSRATPLQTSKLSTVRPSVAR